ncbi:uncharacterized protein LOC108225836 [Daucus carota subsp. sativus]|uniref:uncharacterized protein LOC108225836 n=1 Tax=Daucus carota subsp. sativus TaxID=79200 RepID=UPI0007EF3FF9|nr:PREDICTED: uncharacterized protein LOC108225836 [Daucus carota subsp. sativus]
MIVVEPQGRSGGLALLWKESDQVKLSSLSQNHIDVELTTQDSQTWRLTGFHGEPNRNLRRRTWDLLSNLARDSNLPWCIIGDLNIITSQQDKKGGAAYPQRLIDGFNALLEETGLHDIIKDNWEGDNEGSSIIQKVKQCAEHLDTWGKEITGYFGKRLKACKMQLKQLRDKRDAQSVQQYKDAKHQLHLILDQKELFWRQGSKQLWLNSGDKNTKYFHASCSTCRRINRIHKLKDGNGEWVNWQTGLKPLITEFYSSLFSMEQTNCYEVIGCIAPKISEVQNAELL